MNKIDTIPEWVFEFQIHMENTETNIVIENLYERNEDELFGSSLYTLS